MKKRIPRVTVLMPIFNPGQYLGEAIESILTQTFRDFDLLIINDGSTDRSADIVKKYADKRIKFVNNRKHRGLVSVLNQGLSLIHSEYLVRMDGDDISLPSRIKKQVNFMDTHPEIDICGTWFEVFWSATKRRIFTRPSDPKACKAMLLFLDPVCHATTIMRMVKLKKYHLKFDPSFKHLEDYEFFNRVSQQLNFSNISEVLYLYRYHDKRTGKLYKREQNNQMKRVQEIYLRKLGIIFPEKYIDLHWRVQTKLYKPSRTFMYKASKWFQMLLATNEKSLVYDPEEFGKIINQRWAIAYRAYYAYRLTYLKLGWLIKLKNLTLACFQSIRRRLLLPLKYTRWAKYSSKFFLSPKIFGALRFGEKLPTTIEITKRVR